MADDERRAEIEAVADAIGRADRLAPTDREVWLEMADAAIAALDRVRDARGGESHTKACVQGEIDSECPCEAARSPQGEDHDG